MDALRRRPSGATLRKIAALSGLSQRHTRRCLDSLAEQNIAIRVSDAVADGHQTVTVPLWRLTFSPECLEMLGRMQRMEPVPAVSSTNAGVPHRYWGMFWSGTTGSKLRMDKDGLHIAGSLIGSRNIAAENWALRHAATEDLAELRQMRGYDIGAVARAIDAELRRRGHAFVG